jgi:hypothetical protein
MQTLKQELLRRHFFHTLSILFDLNLMLIELTCFSDGEKNPSAVKEGRPAWMRTLHGRCAEWLSLLPASLAPLRRTLDNIKDPLYRYWKTGLISSVGDPLHLVRIRIRIRFSG